MMSKGKPHILPLEVHKAIEYFRQYDEINGNRFPDYVKFIEFELMHRIDKKKCITLFEYYKENPFKYIVALKEGYIVEQLVTLEKGLNTYFDGKDAVIVHKKNGKRYVINKEKELPSGVTLSKLDQYNWYVNLDRGEVTVPKTVAYNVGLTNNGTRDWFDINDVD